MKVILTHEVTSLGTAGDVVDVKDGYARNFLFRRGLATAWTKGGQKQVDAINKGREVRAVKTLEEAKSIKGNLEAKAVKVEAHAGRSGRLFGAVSTADIAAAVKAAGGPELDRRKIEVAQPDQDGRCRRGARAPAPRRAGHREARRRRRLTSEGSSEGPVPPRGGAGPSRIRVRLLPLPARSRHSGQPMRVTTMRGGSRSDWPTTQ